MVTAYKELPDLLDVHGAKPPLWKRLVFVSIGVVCIVLGIIGWLVPVITGIPFYVAALVYFARASERARAWINRLERRLPRRLRLKLRDYQQRFKKRPAAHESVSRPSV